MVNDQSLIHQGFTLIELLVVIAIIGILAVAIMTLVNPVAQFQKANDARRKSDLSQLQKTLEAYYSDNGSYPPHSTSGTLYRLFPGSMYDWGSTWTAYDTTLPKDPSSNSRNYAYYASAGGQSYYLYASLERGSQDPQVCTSGGTGICSSISSNSISTTACGASVTCNYGVTSSNVSP